MPSMLEEGGYICIPCAEEEMLTPGKARKKIKRAKAFKSEQEANRTTPSLVRSRRCSPITVVPEELRVTPKRPLGVYGAYTAIHLSHPHKTSIAACAYERYSHKVLTEDVLEVTCLNCLKIIGNPKDGTTNT